MKPLLPVLWLALLTLTACGRELPYTNIDNDRLEALLRQGVVLIDIRRPDEWRRTGIVPGSHPLTLFDSGGRPLPEFFRRLPQIAPPDRPVALICRTGNRTRSAARLLTGQLGYRQVYNVRRGITQWIAEGRPVVPWPPRRE